MSNGALLHISIRTVQQRSSVYGKQRWGQIKTIIITVLIFNKLDILPFNFADFGLQLNDPNLIIVLNTPNEVSWHKFNY